ncbi:hypothetical protein QV65_15525 [Rhodococcus erythropolis]|nr:hypothetical protein QV65_15525 [Rhodococcus erythropolis]
MLGRSFCAQSDIVKGAHSEEIFGVVLDRIDLREGVGPDPAAQAVVQDRGGEGSSGVIERFAAQLGVREWAFAQLGCASGVAAEPQPEHRRRAHGLRSSRAGHELYLLEGGQLTRAHRIPV